MKLLLLILLTPAIILGAPITAGYFNTDFRGFNSVSESLPKAAFKLPPSESYELKARSEFPSLPVYTNRIPIISFPYPSVIRAHPSPMFQVRDHASAMERQTSNTFLTNMPPAFPKNIFHVQNTPQMFVTKHNIPQFENFMPNKFLTNMPSSFHSHTLPRIFQIRNRFSPPAIKPAAIIVHRPVIKQFRSQDEQGGYHFNYSGGPTSRSETRSHDGVVKGSYSYVDPNGILKNYNYIADKKGYRVKEEESLLNEMEQRKYPVDLVAAGTTAYKNLPLNNHVYG